MAGLDDINKDEETEEPTKVNKKKILLFLLPVLIAIGIAVGLYHTFESSFNNIQGLPYSVLEQEGDAAKEGKKALIFYDLPEMTIPLKTVKGDEEIANFNLSIELTNKEDIAKIEILLPRFYNIIIAHTQELHPEEVSGAEGLYWLKEELLYRLNLAAAPIKISNINFKTFEVKKK